VLMMQDKVDVPELIEYISPDRSPDIEESIVIILASIGRQDEVSGRPHIVVKHRVESEEVDLIRLVSSCRVMCCHVTAVEVCCCLCLLGTSILRDIGVELADVTCVFDVERRVLVHMNLGSVTTYPRIHIKVD